MQGSQRLGAHGQALTDLGPQLLSQAGFWSSSPGSDSSFSITEGGSAPVGSSRDELSRGAGRRGSPGSGNRGRSEGPGIVASTMDRKEGTGPWELNMGDRNWMKRSRENKEWEKERESCEGKQGRRKGVKQERLGTGVHAESREDYGEDSKRRYAGRGE